MSSLNPEELYRSESDALQRVAFVICRSQHDAEQVVQEAFARLLERQERLETYESPAGWLYRVVVRLAVRERDTHQRFAALPDQLQASQASWIVEDPVLIDAIRELPAHQRGAIALRYYADRSTKEIGEALGCSSSTVRVHLHRARRSLARTLHHLENHDD